MKKICKTKIFSGMKDINFIGIRSTSWFRKVRKIILGSFFSVIFKILVVHGKKINELLNKKPHKNDDIVIKENGGITCN